jgi:uncharacterized protein (UPF0297 family)
VKDKFKETMGYVVSVLEDAGYEPYDQLYAYASTGNESYITRKGDARKLIAQLDREQIWNYIEPHIKQKGR